MPNYRRMRVPGGTYFFSVRLARAGSNGLINNIHILREAFRSEMRSHPFEIVDAVILPDHLHTIWRLPAGDADFSNRWRRIKTNVTKAICPKNHVSPSKTSKGEKGFWQRRFWEHRIRSEEELALYRAYCWFNPVKHGLARNVSDWPHSSFHRAVRNGEVQADWQFAA